MNANLSGPGADRPSPQLTLLLGACVLVLAMAGYAWKGSPGLKPVATAAAGAEDAKEQAERAQIESLVGKLVQRLEAQPDDANGWLMLGRAHATLGRLDEALAAYEHAAALRPDDASTLAEQADALAAKSGGHTTPQIDALIARALAAEPMHLKSLALAAASAFERGDYALAVAHWEKLAQGLPPGSPDAQRLQAGMAEARRRGGLDAPTPAPAASNTAVTGTVVLAPELADKASPGDTVFVFARAVQGPRMPLAVQRAQVKDLPLNFRLDDSMAMAQNAKLSSTAQVSVVARISKSGSAVAKSGDLEGEAAPVAPGASGVSITIRSVVER